MKVQRRPMAVFGAITLALGLATGAAASGRTSVTGALLLGGQQSDFLAVQADSTGGGGADGSAVYRNGGLFVRVHITCMLVRADHTVVVGGSLAAGGGSGTIFPFYAFVLQDNGVAHEQSPSLRGRHRPVAWNVGRYDGRRQPRSPPLTSIRLEIAEDSCCDYNTIGILCCARTFIDARTPIVFWGPAALGKAAAGCDPRATVLVPRTMKGWPRSEGSGALQPSYAREWRIMKASKPSSATCIHW